MADRYLLESGSPDGYLLEDGSGVLLLDANPLASSLTDNFDDNSQAAAWGQGQLKSASTVTTGVTVSETNQRLEVTPNTGSGTVAFSGYLSAARYSLLNDSAFVKISHSAAVPSGQETFLAFGDSQNAYLALINDTVCLLQLVKAGVGVSNTGSFAYSSTTHAWLRLRYDGTSLYLDTATSSASDPPVSGDWTNRITLSPDAAIDFLGGQIALNSGTTFAVTPATARFDGFNTATTASSDVTVALTGQSVTGSIGTLVAAAALALAGQALTTTQGSVVGGQPVTGQSTSVARGTVAATTSVALTGQSVSVARGTLVPGTAEALSGQSLAAAQGMPIPGTAPALTGQSTTVSRGTLAPSSSFALSGQSIVVAGGTVAPANSVSISGQSLTGAQGTISVGASSNVTAALTGQSITAAQGSVTASTAIALLGQSAGLGQGAISAGIILGVTGQTINVASGTLSPSTSPALIGLSLSAASGNVVVFSSDVTASLTGQGIGLGLGTIIATAVNGSPQLQDIFVNGENLADEPLPAAGALNLITKPSGQIVNHPPYPAA